MPFPFYVPVRARSDAADESLSSAQKSSDPQIIVGTGYSICGIPAGAWFPAFAGEPANNLSLLAYCAFVWKESYKASEAIGEASCHINGADFSVFQIAALARTGDTGDFAGRSDDFNSDAGW